MNDTTPQPETNDLRIVETSGEPCRFLRHNGMYIFSAEQLADYDDSATNFWCLKTQKVFGPDDEMVGRADCRNAGRPCYQPL